ncbi:hypothetical protein D3C87_1891350 [compost metagenome]
MLIVWLVKVKSLLFAVLKETGFTTKFAVALEGLVTFILNAKVPAFSLTLIKVLSKEMLVPAVVKILDVAVVTALSLVSSTIFGFKAK